jgi:hypothetical protein
LYARSSFLDRSWHSRMPLGSTRARLKLLYACDPMAFLSGGCPLPLTMARKIQTEHWMASHHTAGLHGGSRTNDVTPH